MPGSIEASERRSSLKAMIDTGTLVRAIDVHSGLSALIAEHASATRPDGTKASFNAMWSSSLTSSTIKGKPDIETVDTTERLQIVEDALEVCSKPMIYDGDTGGLAEIFYFTVRKLERLGVSAVIIEDKAGLKQNSLFGTDRKQQLEDVGVFQEKIRMGRSACFSNDFMVIARLEALIAGYGVQEALDRAAAYIDADVDGIMIHSKEKRPDEVVEFLNEYAKFSKRVPLVAVPTTYNSITEDELQDLGVNVCIHANHLLRAAYPSMMSAAETILQNSRSKEADSICMPVKQILTLIPEPSK